MLRYIVYFVEILICCILQTSLFSYFRISMVVPNCLLILVVAVAYTKGQIHGMVVGFISGLLLDILFSETIGMCSLIYIIIGFLCGLTNRLYRSADFLLPSISLVSGELLYSVCFYMLSFFLEGKLSFFTYFVHTIIPRIIYTFIVSLILYPVFLIIHMKLCEKEG